MATNNIGSKVYIACESDGTTPDPFTDANLPLASSELGTLSWVQIPKIGTVGDTGVEQNETQYDTWDSNLSLKQKGIATGKSIEIRFLDESSNGKTAVETAASVSDQNNYAFKIEKTDGSIEYTAGRVHSVGRSKGGPEDHSEIYFTLSANQESVLS